MKNKKLIFVSLISNIVLVIILGVILMKSNVCTIIKNKFRTQEITYNPYSHPLYVNTKEIHKSLKVNTLQGGVRLCW